MYIRLIGYLITISSIHVLLMWCHWSLVWNLMWLRVRLKELAETEHFCWLFQKEVLRCVDYACVQTVVKATCIICLINMFLSIWSKSKYGSAGILQFQRIVACALLWALVIWAEHWWLRIYCFGFVGVHFGFELFVESQALVLLDEIYCLLLGCKFFILDL